MSPRTRYESARALLGPGAGGWLRNPGAVAGEGRA